MKKQTKLKKGRRKLPPEQIKTKVWTHVPRYIVDFFGGQYEANELIKRIINEQYQKAHQ